MCGLCKTSARARACCAALCMVAQLDEYELRMAEQAREAHAAVQAERAAADRCEAGWAGQHGGLLCLCTRSMQCAK